MSAQTTVNVDPAELAKFEQVAGRWWDADSEFKTLHDINPLRLKYVTDRTDIRDRRVIDVGCGGGILSEALAEAGAKVTGIDLAGASLEVAKLHLHESGLSVDYKQISAEDMAAEQPGQFDVAVCMEMLEHVPEPASVVKACAQLVRPGGDVFLSTINRKPLAWALVVVGAEYLTRLVPRGTHHYEKFIKPSELDRWCRDAGLEIRDIKGMVYNPLLRSASLSRRVDANYLVHYRRS